MERQIENVRMVDRSIRSSPSRLTRSPASPDSNYEYPRTFKGPSLRRTESGNLADDYKQDGPFNVPDPVTTLHPRNMRSVHVGGIPPIRGMPSQRSPGASPPNTQAPDKSAENAGARPGLHPPPSNINRPGNMPDATDLSLGIKKPGDTKHKGFKNVHSLFHRGKAHGGLDSRPSSGASNSEDGFVATPQYGNEFGNPTHHGPPSTIIPVVGGPSTGIVPVTVLRGPIGTVPVTVLGEDTSKSGFFKRGKKKPAPVEPKVEGPPITWIANDPEESQYKIGKNLDDSIQILKDIRTVMDPIYDARAAIRKAEREKVAAEAADNEGKGDAMNIIFKDSEVLDVDPENQNHVVHHGFKGKERTMDIFGNPTVEIDPAKYTTPVSKGFVRSIDTPGTDDFDSPIDDPFTPVYFRQGRRVEESSAPKRAPTAFYKNSSAANSQLHHSSKNKVHLPSSNEYEMHSFPNDGDASTPKRKAFMGSPVKKDPRNETLEYLPIKGAPGKFMRNPYFPEVDAVPAFPTGPTMSPSKFINSEKITATLGLDEASANEYKETKVGDTEIQGVEPILPDLLSRGYIEDCEDNTNFLDQIHPPITPRKVINKSPKKKEEEAPRTLLRQYFDTQALDPTDTTARPPPVQLSPGDGIRRLGIDAARRLAEKRSIDFYHRYLLEDALDQPGSLNLAPEIEALANASTRRVHAGNQAHFDRTLPIGPGIIDPEENRGLEVLGILAPRVHVEDIGLKKGGDQSVEDLQKRARALGMPKKQIDDLGDTIMESDLFDMRDEWKATVAGLKTEEEKNQEKKRGWMLNWW